METANTFTIHPSNLNKLFKIGVGYINVRSRPDEAVLDIIM
jgi:hypothetical protein